MSIERIFGGWDDEPDGDFTTRGRNYRSGAAKDSLCDLWHSLAAQNVGTPHQVNNCGLSQRKSEIIPLWELYLRARPKVVLEVGVAQGGTWAAWCKLGDPDATIIGIDRDVNDCRPRPGDPVSAHLTRGGGTFAPMTTHGGGMHAYRIYSQVIIPINGWTTDPRVKEELKAALAGRTIDWCFHDASHHWPDFHNDFVWLWPLISDGGIFASHDIQPCSDEKSNKAPEWERIKREESYSACFEFRGPTGSESYGIGAIVK